MLDIPLDPMNSATNPVEPFLRMDRMPHIWCPGCGIGTTVNCFTRALESSKLDLNKVAIVSGIGCTGRVAATRLAEELGRKVVLNIVMVGFFAAVTHMLDPDSLRQSVADSVPPAMQKLNLQAFDKGFEYGAELVHRLAENGDAEHALALESES